MGLEANEEAGDSGLLVELLVVATSGGGSKGRRAERQMRASGGGAASGAQGEEKGEEVLARGRQGVWRRRTRHGGEEGGRLMRGAMGG